MALVVEGRPSWPGHCSKGTQLQPWSCRKNSGIDDGTCHSISQVCYQQTRWCCHCLQIVDYALADTVCKMCSHAYCDSFFYSSHAMKLGLCLLYFEFTLLTNVKYIRVKCNILLYRYWQHLQSMQRRVYETAWCLSVCLSQHGPAAGNTCVLQVCCFCNVLNLSYDMFCVELDVKSYPHTPVHNESVYS